MIKSTAALMILFVGFTFWGQTLHNLSELEKMTSEARKKSVQFYSDEWLLKGNLFLPPGFDSTKNYPAIIVSGSWTTVKEQMAGLYAELLANEGFIALAFDFRNFGESEGEPRCYESPQLKKRDIINAVSFLSSVPGVDKEKIGVLGICAGAMYSLLSAAEDPRIKAIVTVASWLHDAVAVNMIYGGPSRPLIVQLLLRNGNLRPIQNPEQSVWNFPAPIGRKEVVAVPLSETITISKHLNVNNINTSFLSQLRQSNFL